MHFILPTLDVDIYNSKINEFFENNRFFLSSLEKRQKVQRCPFFWIFNLMDIIKEAMADVWPHAVYIHFLMKTIANFCFSSQNPWDQKKCLMDKHTFRRRCVKSYLIIPFSWYHTLWGPCFLTKATTKKPLLKKKTNLFFGSWCSM